MDSPLPRFDFLSEWNMTSQHWFDTDLSIFEDELPLDLLDVELDVYPVHDPAAPAAISVPHVPERSAPMSNGLGTMPAGQDQEHPQPQIQSQFQSYVYTNQDVGLSPEQVSNDIMVPMSLHELMELGMEIQKQVDGIGFLAEPGTPHLDQAAVGMEEQEQEQGQNAYPYESPETSWVTSGTRDKEHRRQRKAILSGKKKTAKCVVALPVSFSTFHQQPKDIIDHTMDNDGELSKVASMQEDDEEEMRETDNEDESMWCDSKGSDATEVRNMSLEEQQRQLVILKHSLKTRAPAMKRSKNKSLLTSEALQTEIQRLLQESKQIYRNVHQLMNEREHFVSENQVLLDRYTKLVHGSGSGSM